MRAERGKISWLSPSDVVQDGKRNRSVGGGNRFTQNLSFLAFLHSLSPLAFHLSMKHAGGGGPS